MIRILLLCALSLSPACAFRKQVSAHAANLLVETDSVTTEEKARRALIRRQAAAPSYSQIVGDGQCRYGSNEKEFSTSATSSDVFGCESACQAAHGCTAYTFIAHQDKCFLYSGGPYTYGDGSAGYVCYQLRAACEDASNTGYNINGNPATCSQLKPYCEHATHGAGIQAKCLVTCGICQACTADASCGPGLSCRNGMCKTFTNITIGNEIYFLDASDLFEYGDTNGDGELGIHDIFDGDQVPDESEEAFNHHDTDRSRRLTRSEFEEGASTWFNQKTIGFSTTSNIFITDDAPTPVRVSSDDQFVPKVNDVYLFSDPPILPDGHQQTAKAVNIAKRYYNVFLSTNVLRRGIGLAIYDIGMMTPCATLSIKKWYHPCAAVKIMFWEKRYWISPFEEKKLKKTSTFNTCDDSSLLNPFPLARSACFGLAAALRGHPGHAALSNKAHAITLMEEAALQYGRLTGRAALSAQAAASAYTIGQVTQELEYGDDLFKFEQAFDCNNGIAIAGFSTTRAHLAASLWQAADGDCIFAFKGTSSLWELWKDLSSGTANWCGQEWMAPIVEVMKAYLERPEFQLLLKRVGNTCYKNGLTVTGHSLGADLAYMFSWCLENGPAGHADYEQLKGLFTATGNIQQDGKCAVIPAPYAAGGTDGSCPAGTARVQTSECQTLTGIRLDNGVTIKGWGREDCAGHFTPGMGCFSNGRNTYSTRSGCTSATGASGHYAVCKTQPQALCLWSSSEISCCQVQSESSGTCGYCPPEPNNVLTQCSSAWKQCDCVEPAMPAWSNGDYEEACFTAVPQECLAELCADSAGTCQTTCAGYHCPSGFFNAELVGQGRNFATCCVPLTCATSPSLLETADNSFKAQCQVIISITLQREWQITSNAFENKFKLAVGEKGLTIGELEESYVQEELTLTDQFGNVAGDELTYPLHMRYVFKPHESSFLDHTAGRRLTAGAVTICDKTEFEVVKGDTEAGVQRILSGLNEWIMSAASGAWGAYMKREFGPLVYCARHLMPTYSTRIMVCAKRMQAATPEVTDVKEQSKEAFKLLRMIVMEHFLTSLVGGTDSPLRPDFMASFGPDGNMEAMGQQKFNEEDGTLELPTAVTRYTLTFEVKSLVTTAKGAGRSLVSGWFDQSSYTGQVKLRTHPASAFVREYYIANGAHNACTSRNKHTNDQCEAMLEKKENCQCDVELCIAPKCHSHFAAGTCSRLKLSKMIKGVYHGCFSLKGKFKGKC